MVSHEMITSGSPTEQFEICVSGAYFRGIWFPECGGHVTDRHKRQDPSTKAHKLTLTRRVSRMCAAPVPVEHHTVAYALIEKKGKDTQHPSDTR